jgi:hypothetical protein
MSAALPITALVGISDLFPTQMTVGLREVNIKRKRWRDAQSRTARDQILASHTVPVVRLRDSFYLIDRHHFIRALRDEGVNLVEVEIIDEFDDLGASDFWTTLGARGWMHPYDDKGQQHHHAAMPRSIDGLTDDPYRSLASALRRAGGYTKNTAPFSEFCWANFLRTRIDRTILEDDFDGSVHIAFALASSAEAAALPGWIGGRAEQAA